MSSGLTVDNFPRNNRIIFHDVKNAYCYPLSVDRGYYKKYTWLCGSGYYKNVYKTFEHPTQEIIAIAKVRFDTLTEKRVAVNEVEMHLLCEGNDFIQPLKHYFVYYSFSKKMDRVMFCFPFCEFTLFNVPLFPMQKVILLRRALVGLSFLHNNGIVHGDFKPENVSIKVKNLGKISDYKALLADLGGCFKEGAPSENIITTLSHSSPEVSKYNMHTYPGIVCGRPHDIWSAGIVFYNCFFKRSLFPADRKLCRIYSFLLEMKRYDDALNLTPYMIEEFFNTLVDGPVATLIKGCLQINPDNRIKINGFINSLNDIIEHDNF